DGVVQDYAAALHLLRLAAVQGFAPAQWRLGSILSQTALANQFGVKVDRVAALRWLEAAAWQGHEEAMTAMACAYEYGFGTTADLATAARWWRRLANRGDPAAEHRLGVIALNGGLKAQAVYWFQRAARQGDTLAERHLADLAELGVSTARQTAV